MTAAELMRQLHASYPIYRDALGREWRYWTQPEVLGICLPLNFDERQLTPTDPTSYLWFESGALLLRTPYPVHEEERAIPLEKIADHFRAALGDNVL